MTGFSKKQLQVLTFPYGDKSALICDGSIRSGKTTAELVSFVLWAMSTFQGQQFALCSRSVKAGERNLVKPLLGVQYLRQQFTVQYKVTDSTLIVSRGGVSNVFYVFGGKDERSYTLVQGVTLAGALLDEVALMPRSFVEQVLARCSVDGSRYYFSCNPGSPQHWFKREWIDQAARRGAVYLHFTMRDNPGLSPKKVAEYERMYTGVFYARYILGQWVVAEGLVYKFFADDPRRYTLSGDTAGIQGRFFVSIDYGTHNPTSMGLWCIQRDRAIRIAESYYDGRATERPRTDEEHYAALEELCRGYYVESVIVDSSAASFIETIRRHGRFRVRAAVNDVLPGIQVVATLLQAGRLVIHDRCRDSIREFGLYRWDDKSPADTVIKDNDHAMDDIRYFASTVLAREFRWADWAGAGRARTATYRPGGKTPGYHH